MNRFDGYFSLWHPKHRRSRPVYGELILKPLREADRAHGSESANGSISTLFAFWECLQLLQPAYHRRVSCARDDGYNTFGSP